MADNTNILPDSIRQFDHIKAFDAMFEARMSAIELEAVLVYIIDSVAESALPFLAQQFNVSGNSGWLVANTEQQKRDLIKKGIDINRKIGTVYAIKEAMLSLGFGTPFLVEGTGTWAEFDIQIDLANAQGFSGSQATNLTALINEYKNARSKLLGISFITNLSDELPMQEDTLTFNIDTNIEDEILIKRIAKYDGTLKYDGETIYDDENDYLDFNEETI